MVDTAIGREGFLSHSVIGPLEKIYQFQISQQITTNLTTMNGTNKKLQILKQILQRPTRPRESSAGCSALNGPTYATYTTDTCTPPQLLHLFYD